MIGLIIGDGTVTKDNKLRITHSYKQREYCTYKAKLLHSVFGGNDIKVHEKLQKYTTRINKEKVTKYAECV